jgi:hypothetical protein
MIRSKVLGLALAAVGFASTFMVTEANAQLFRRWRNDRCCCPTYHNNCCNTNNCCDNHYTVGYANCCAPTMTYATMQAPATMPAPTYTTQMANPPMGVYTSGGYGDCCGGGYAYGGDCCGGCDSCCHGRGHRHNCCGYNDCGSSSCCDSCCGHRGGWFRRGRCCNDCYTGSSCCGYGGYGNNCCGGYGGGYGYGGGDCCGGGYLQSPVPAQGVPGGMEPTPEGGAVPPPPPNDT